MASAAGGKPVSRRERAVATRQRMVEAAYRQMSTRGYAQTTMADIATEAGVAVQTVYFTFHNKPAVMRAAFEFAVHGDHLPLSPHQRSWFDVMRAAPDCETALGMFVDANLVILHRVLPLASMFAAIGHDPEIASFHAFSEQLRRQGFRAVVEVLAGKRGLRSGLDADDATSVLLALLGTDVYRSLVSESGWPEAKWRAWVIQTVSDALFAP